LQLIEHQVVATKSFKSRPLRQALNGAPMDVKYQSEISTPHTVIEITNQLKVLIKSTGRSNYFISQDDEYMTAMKRTPPGEIMGTIYFADQSDTAPATKGIDAWKYYLDNQY
jgi:hypothetical protein